MSLRDLASKAVMILEDGEIFTPGWKEEAEELANALRAALAEPQPEPVAFFNPQKGKFRWAKPTSYHAPVSIAVPDLPLYTTPPQRQPLSDEDIARLWSWSMTAEAERTANTQQHAFARAIEKAHNIGGDK